MENIPYRGTTLQVRKRRPTGWQVLIVTGDIGGAWKDVPQTNDPEGRETVVAEAKRIVDELINQQQRFI